MRKKEHPHAAIITDLGGPSEVARKLNMQGRAAATVWNWRMRGIPWRWRLAVADLLTAEGKNVPENLLSSEAA